TEADIYSLTAAGISCKFVYNKLNNSWKTIPENDLIINHIYQGGKITGFTVRDSKGIVYYFGNGNTNELSISEKFNGYVLSDDYFDSWYLYKMETHDGNYAIYFDYVPEKYSYEQLGSASISIGNIYFS